MFDQFAVLLVGGIGGGRIGVVRGIAVAGGSAIGRIDKGRIDLGRIGRGRIVDGGIGGVRRLPSIKNRSPFSRRNGRFLVLQLQPACPDLACQRLLRKRCQLRALRHEDQKFAVAHLPIPLRDAQKFSSRIESSHGRRNDIPARDISASGGRSGSDRLLNQGIKKVECPMPSDASSSPNQGAVTIQPEKENGPAARGHRSAICSAVIVTYGNHPASGCYLSSAGRRPARRR